MIALISFESDLILPIEEVKALSLQYKDIERLGVKDGRLHEMGGYSGYYFKDDLTETIEDEKTVYLNQDGKKVDRYFIYTRPTTDTHYVLVGKENHLVNLLEFTKACRHKFYIEKAIEPQEPSPALLQGILVEMEEKMRRAQKAVDSLHNNTFNQKVNVHVGGGLITTYNELKLREDSCSDLIQNDLNSGWRVIAVCVQPDQRRPDYILGRFNPNLDGSSMPNGAAR